MSASPGTRSAVVVFDLGGVLSVPQDLLPRLAHIAGTPVEAFEQAYWGYRAPYDAGGLDEDFWGPVVAAAGGSPGAALTRLLTDADCEIWGDLPPGSRGLLGELAARGARLGLLSNAPTAMARWVRACDWARPFEHLVVSGEQGAVKPDAVIYELTAGLFAADPGDIVFFDDRADNVAGARGCGWDAHLWTGLADARDMLRDRGILPAQPPDAHRPTPGGLPAPGVPG